MINRFKVALLKRYELSEEGYRRTLGEIKPDKGETEFQFERVIYTMDFDDNVGMQL